MNKLKKLIDSKKSIIGIVGLGYVGLPLAKRFCEQGFTIYGFDIDETKVATLNSGKSYINHIDDKEIGKMIESQFMAVNKFDLISKTDVIIICVPTPLGIHNEPDLTYITQTLELIKPKIRKNQLLVLESTTYPGTTEEEICTFIEQLNYDIGSDYFIGYSPEREDPGNESFTTKTIPKVVSGHSTNCLSLVKSLYGQVVDKIVPVSNTKVAEMTKILENIHRAVNIGLVNELKIVADKMDIDIYEVINAAATKPFGFTPYYPGPGLGGHCIPIDPFYLSWKAKEVGMNTRFIELAGEINQSMPSYVVSKTTTALNGRGKSINNSKIIVLGLSYKKNVDDLRESPSLKIIDKLINRGAKVYFSDPFFTELPSIRSFKSKIPSKGVNKKNLNSVDLVILATDHDNFDYKLILKESKIIVDTRGRFKNNSKVINA